MQKLTFCFNPKTDKKEEILRKIPKMNHSSHFLNNSSHILNNSSHFLNNSNILNNSSYVLNNNSNTFQVNSLICAGNAINLCLSIVSFPLNFVLFVSTINSTLAVGPKILLGNLAFALGLLAATEIHRTVSFLYIYTNFDVSFLKIDGT